MPGDFSTRRGTKWAVAGLALLLAGVTFASRHWLLEHLLPNPVARVTPEDESLVADDGPDLANGVSFDPAANRVVRRGPNGESLWSTPLTGNLGRVYSPHVRADDARAYVPHTDGVTALDLRTGAVLWHSAGPAGGLMLSGPLLLATGSGTGGGGLPPGQWLLARDTTTGGEVFRVPLHAEGFNPRPAADAAGLVLVSDWGTPGGHGFSLLADRTGRVLHRFDRQVVAAHALPGGDRLVLTSRDVVRLTESGAVAWVAPFQGEEWIAGGGFVPLPGGDVAAFLYGRIWDGGVQVTRLDADTGARRWVVYCNGLGVSHSIYQHAAEARLVGDRLRVASHGCGGTFVQVLDAGSGRSLGRDQRVTGGKQVR